MKILSLLAFVAILFFQTSCSQDSSFGVKQREQATANQEIPDSDNDARENRGPSGLPIPSGAPDGTETSQNETPMPQIPELVAVENLTIEANSPTEATVTWDKLELKVDGYVIVKMQITSDEESDNKSEAEEHLYPELKCAEGVRLEDNQIQFEMLKADQSLVVKVCAVRGDEIGPESSTKELMPAYDAQAPANLRIVPKQRSLELSWDNPNELANKGFKVSVVPKGQSHAQTYIDVGLKTEMEQTGLTPYTEYDVAIVAYNSRDIESSPTTGSERTLAYDPSAPTNLELVPSLNSIALSWQNPASDKNKGFIVKLVQGDVAISCEGGVDVGNNTSLQASSVIPGSTTLASYTIYTAAVCAYNVKNERSQSSVGKTRTLAPPAVTPIITVVDPSEKSAYIGWDNPGGASTQGYFLNYAQGESAPGCQSNGRQQLPANASNYTLSNLAPYTNYSVSLCSFNVAGAVSAPDTKSFRTDAMAPILPEDLLADSGIDTVDTSWSNPAPEASKGFKIGITEPGAAPSCQDPMVDVAASTSHVFNGLAPYTEYVVYLCAYGQDQNPVGPAVVTVRTKDANPNAPRNLDAKASSHEQIDLAWEIDKSPESYLLSVVEGDQAPSSCEGNAKPLSADLTAHAVQELQGDTLYSFSLCALNRDGKISAPAMASARTDGKKHTIAPIEVPICDAFGEGSGDQGLGTNFGIRGQIFDAGEKLYTFDEIKQSAQSNGGVIENPLFMDQLNVPTRAWESGFVKGEKSDGSPDLVLNSQGDPLIEFFGISFEGRIQLAKDEQGHPIEEEGLYQIVALSDDGVVLEMSESENGDKKKILDSNKAHATKLVCPSQTIEVSKNAALPFSLDYFQAPRYHIALILLWRKVGELGDSVQKYSDVKSQVDVDCNRSSSSTWFDSNNGYVPTQRYERLTQQEGFKVLGPSNFLLPQEEDVNPCSDPTYEPPLRDNCFKEDITLSTDPVITLKKDEIDASTLKVLLNGEEVEQSNYQFDAQSGQVTLLRSVDYSDKVSVSYCQNLSE